MKIFGFYITKIDWLKRHQELSVEYMQVKIFLNAQTKALLDLKKVLENKGFNFDNTEDLL